MRLAGAFDSIESNTLIKLRNRAFDPRYGLQLRASERDGNDAARALFPAEKAMVTEAP